MSVQPSSDGDRALDPVLDGGLLLELLGLAGWEIHVSLHDLGVKASGRRGAVEIVQFGRSVAEIAIEFFKAAYETESPDVTPAVDDVLFAMRRSFPSTPEQRAMPS